MKDAIIVFQNGELTPTITESMIYWEETIKSANKFRDHYKEIILKHMEENGIVSLKNDRIEITRLEPTTRTSFDSKKLKDEDFDLYMKYVYESDVKSSVRIKIK